MIAAELFQEKPIVTPLLSITEMKESNIKLIYVLIEGIIEKIMNAKMAILANKATEKLVYISSAIVLVELLGKSIKIVATDSETIIDQACQDLTVMLLYANQRNNALLLDEVTELLTQIF